MTSSGLRKYSQIQPFAADARRAFVVASDEAFGLSRMFQMLVDADPDSFIVVRDMPEALAFLGLDATFTWPAGPPDAIFGSGAGP
jgi:hypothetical protein